MQELVENATVMMGMGETPNVDITPFVISIERNSSICDILHHYVINLMPEFSTFVSELGFWLKPYDSLSIDEMGVRVFNGYISRVRIGKKPARSFVIEGDHKYKRARDYFNDDINEVSKGENVNFWANALTTRCGITYTCDDQFLGTRGIAPGTEFGLRNVADCLETLAAYAGGYFYMNTSGILHLHRGQFIDKKNYIIASGGDNFGYEYTYSEPIIDTPGSGLTGTYYSVYYDPFRWPLPIIETYGPEEIRIDSQIDFAWTALESPVGVVNGADLWVVNWSGMIVSPETTGYQFRLNWVGEASAQLLINDEIILTTPPEGYVHTVTSEVIPIYNVPPNPPAEALIPKEITSSYITLSGGTPYKIRIDYAKNLVCEKRKVFTNPSAGDIWQPYQTDSYIQLSWSSENIPWEIIPSGNLYAYTPTSHMTSTSRKIDSNVFHAEWYKDDAVSRNHIMVWGFKDPNIALASGESAWISSERWNDLALPVNRTVLYSSPMIQTQEEADRLSNNLAKAFNHYNSIKTFEINGTPEALLGTKCIYYVHLEDQTVGTTITGNGPITSLNSKMDEEGYITTIKIDETCPKLAGWAVEPQQLKNIWIAAAQLSPAEGGNGVDIIQQKLIYTSDFGLGGQPTYHIIKGIPEGQIVGMTPLRDESVLFLLMYDPSSKIHSLWSSKNPTEQNGTWTLEMKTGDSIDTSKFIGPVDNTLMVEPTAISIDYLFFNVSPFGSMQACGKTLYLGVRWIASVTFPTAQTIRRHMVAIYKDGAWTYKYLKHSFEGNGAEAPYNFPGSILAGGGTGCRGGISAAVSNFGHYYHGTLGWAPGHMVGLSTTRDKYCAREINNFDNPVINGTLRVGNGNGGIGGIWTNDLGTTESNTVFYRLSTDFNYLSGGVVVNNTGASLVTNDRKLINNTFDRNLGRTVIRGDYYGSQVQLVTPDTVQIPGYGDNQGELWLSTSGNTFNKIFTWKTGTVICIDPKSPKRLAWFARNYGTRYVSSAGNEQARISEDGGATWTAMTGNWWGDNAGILADTAIQNGGNINIINVEPTFVINE